MPRNKETNEFEAGALRTITYKGQKYFVDGRLRQVRHTNDFSNVLDVDGFDDDEWNKLSKKDQKTICGEFYGY